MFARLSILVLLSGSSAIGWAASLPDVHDKVALYLKVDASQSPAFLRSMKTELRRIMAQVERDVVWWSPTELGGQTDSDLVVITAKGDCAGPTLDAVPTGAVDNMALASTQEVNGRILPYITVHCDRLNRFLAHGLSGDPSHERQRYGRAMARLVAHELYHFLAQTHEHSDAGLAQPGVTATELLAQEFHFDHESSVELLIPLLVHRTDSALVDDDR